ncbi:MAG: mannose-1-phosphate guanylyltransferase [bacterium]
MSKPYAVIMAGGRGERFWPLSTEEMPKPFHKLVGDKSLFQTTVERLSPIFPPERILPVLAREHLDIARQQLPEIPEGNYVVEPMGRDTAACIGLASISLERLDPEAIMVVLAADHYIPDEAEFRATLEAGINFLQENDVIITLGIKPDRPEIGYGYIEAGEEVTDLEGFSICKVACFVEKPNIDRAREYLSSGKYFWNSGMFLWRNSLIQGLIAKFMPEHWQRLSAIRDSFGTPEEDSTLIKEFSRIKKISIDFGVMEKAENILVILAKFKWDDVGNWAALERVMEPDENGNLLQGNVLTLDTRNCVIYSQDQLVATMGGCDLIIVQANDKIMVASKKCASELKRLVRLYEESA